MKLSQGFYSHQIGDETVLVPVGRADFSGMVRGNAVFGAVLELMKTETSEEEIVAAMKARFDAPEDVIAGDVTKVLSELREIGAVEE